MLDRMHAVVQQAFGGPEVLEVAEIDRPVPLATEVLVRVEAVGVNPVEPLIRSGQFPLIGQPPFILGWDISGVIEHLEGVTRFDIGDEVHGMPFWHGECLSSPTMPASKPWPDWSILGSSASISRRRCP
jgi:NADPH:quinone reductase-like Zn-dependent oxidoreductase